MQVIKGRTQVIHMYRDMHVFSLVASNPSWMWFGYPKGKGARRVFLVSKMDGSTDIYDADKWMHACVTYDKAAGNFTYVLV